MNWLDDYNDASIEFADRLRTLGSSENTITAYDSDLRMMRDWILDQGIIPVNVRDGLEMEPHISAFMNAHRTCWSPKTSRRRLGTYRHCWRVLDPAHPILADYRAPTPSRPDPHPLPGGMADVLKMLVEAREPHHAALVALCGFCGLRVGEALSVRARDWDRKEETLRVRGKGGRERVIPVTPIPAAFLTNAMAFAHLTNDETPIVRLADRSAREAITKIGERAKVGRAVSSHDLRATFATEAYDKSHDIRAVQELLGHATSTQTEVYIGVKARTMREVAEGVL